MDRTAQIKAVTDLIGPVFDALDISDKAADKANTSTAALTAARNVYTRAMTAFWQRTGTGAAVDDATTKLIALQAQQPIDLQAATDLHLKFVTIQQQLAKAVADLLTDPGAVEQV